MKYYKIKLVMFAIVTLILSLLVSAVPIRPYVVDAVLPVSRILKEWHVMLWCVGITLVGCLLLGLFVALILWSTYYLHWRIPRNRGGGRRTWFDEHRDLLDDPAFDSLDLKAIVSCPADGPGAHPGRKLAQVCGASVRRAMGFPDRTRANVILAAQRCDSWLRDKCPNLRHTDFDTVHTRAVVVALTATRNEERMGEALYSPQASRAQHVAHTPHLIPRYEGALGRALSYLGFEVPSVQNF